MREGIEAKLKNITTEISSTEVGVGGALLPFNLLNTLSSRCTNKSMSFLFIPRAAAAVRYGIG